MTKFSPLPAPTKRANFFYFALYCIVLIGFAACKNRDATVPSYLHIASFDFTSDLSKFGNPSSQITDAHVYVNGTLVGIYELPATIPILQEGDVRLIIFPGIKENGAAANRKIMRLYETFERNITLVPNQIDTVYPSTTYKENVFMAWREDYENGVFSTIRSAKSETKDTLIVIPSNHPDAFKGPFSDFSLQVKIEPSEFDEVFEHVSPEKFVVPRFGQDVIVEMDYKTNIFLQIGIYADNGGFIEQIPFIVLNPTTNWNKVYINLSIETSALQPNTPIQLFFGVIKPGSDPTFSPEFFLDNIKLSYLN